MSQPPIRPPGEVAAVAAHLREQGSCCPHAHGLHGPDGACRACTVSSGPCTGWRPAWSFVLPDSEADAPPTSGDDDVLEAVIESSGDPLLDLVHDILTRHFIPDPGGRWLACRDELTTAIRDAARVSWS